MLVWKIDPLPDFLSDHTLTGDSVETKLRAMAARWVQWVSFLSGWADQATFALRFLAAEGETSIFLLAAPHDEGQAPRLANEMGMLVRTYDLGHGAMADTTTSRFALQTTLGDPAVVEVAQRQVPSLWELPESTLGSERFRARFQWLPEAQLRRPTCVYPWWAPGGAFVAPMENLISQPVPVSLTIYLQPTRLMTHEWMWLAAMAREAKTASEQQLHQIGAGSSLRVVDPSSDLAGRLYMANFRRLSGTAFLVRAVCAAADNRQDVAFSVASAVQSVVLEVPLDRPDQDDERLPSGADVRPVEFNSTEERQQSLANLAFPQVDRSRPLIRLPYLADARGAATMFRLPVSVRGGVPGIRVRQTPPDFHPGPRQEAVPDHCLQLGRYHAGGVASIPIPELTKHTLITGFTGSGKTKTVLHLLHQLWVDHGIPFLVLESAKQEYRGLIGVNSLGEDLYVYTLGNETCVPFRLNPFQLLPGIRVESHISKLQSCLEGAIPPIGPSASVISEALLRVYDDHGWNLTDTCPVDQPPRRSFPTLSAFVDIVERILDERGYEGEVRSNLQAALVGRFRPLLMGSKGRMFDTPVCRPDAQELLSRPAILEMNDLNLDDKALVVMFVLTLLREYRELSFDGEPGLRHVTVVEEAHNVLENVDSQGSGEGATTADSRYKAVQAFCQMLTEIRSLGEGLVIADQSPEKLAPDAMRNTNLQIAHQLRDGQDRDAVARAMIMDDEQRDFLGKLPPGQAAVFHTGLEKATFVRIPLYCGSAEEARQHTLRGEGFRASIGDAEVKRHMLQVATDSVADSELSLPFPSCTLCQAACRHRDTGHTLSRDPAARDTFRRWFQWVDADQRAKQDVSFEELWHQGVSLVRSELQRCGAAEDRDGGWCLFTHHWEQTMRELGWSDEHLDATSYELFSQYYQQPEPPRALPSDEDSSRQSVTV